MDKGRKKRTADVAEKLGVGLLLGTVAQGIFAKGIVLNLTPAPKTARFRGHWTIAIVRDWSQIHQKRPIVPSGSS